MKKTLLIISLISFFPIVFKISNYILSSNSNENVNKGKLIEKKGDKIYIGEYEENNIILKLISQDIKNQIKEQKIIIKGDFDKIWENKEIYF